MYMGINVVLLTWAVRKGMLDGTARKAATAWGQCASQTDRSISRPTLHCRRLLWEKQAYCTVHHIYTARGLPWCSGKHSELSWWCPVLQPRYHHIWCWYEFIFSVACWVLTCWRRMEHWCRSETGAAPGLVASSTFSSCSFSAGFSQTAWDKATAENQLLSWSELNNPPHNSCPEVNAATEKSSIEVLSPGRPN